MFGCQKVYDSYDELLDDSEIQAVYIPLPNSMHKEWTIKAARKGKHVLCEKPIALNSDECQEMIQECNKNNVKLMEAFMYRYTDRIKKVKDLLDSSAIGEIKRITSSFSFYLDRENTIKTVPSLGGGSLYDVGCYPINFLGMVTNSKPISITVDYVKDHEVDIACSAILKYENGILCNIQSGFNSFFSNFTEVVGTKGIIHIPDTFQGNAGSISVITSEGKKEIAVEESDRYCLEVEDFADAIINDRDPMFSLEETIRNMEVIEQLLNEAYKK